MFLLVPAFAQTLAPTFRLECRFRGEPKPAQVVMDGTDLGKCPLEVKAFLGRHLLRLYLPEEEGRYLGYEARLEVSEGGDTAFLAELVRYDTRVEALPGARGISGLVYALAYSPQGVLAVGDGTGRIRLLPIAPLWTCLALAAMFATWLLAPGGRYLASATGEGSVRLYDEKGRLLRVLGQGPALLKVGFDLSGRLIGLQLRGRLSLWDPGTGRMVLTQALSPYLFSAALSQGGRLLAVGLSVGRVELRDLATVNKRGEVRLPGGPVYALAFSPDGRYLAVGSADGGVRIVDLFASRDPPPIHLYAHKDLVLSLAYSPDGRYLASGGQDREVRLYDLREGFLDRVYVGHVGPVYGLEFHSSGRFPVTGGGEGRVFLHPLP